MIKNIAINTGRRNETWFDQECQAAKTSTRKHLRRFRRTLKDEDRVSYCIARREYKKLLQKKRIDYNKSLVSKLINSVHDQNNFWSNVHKILPKASHGFSNISVDTWHQHFKDLLEKDVENDEDSDIINTTSCLDNPISKEEVEFAIRKLKNGKSAGPDGLIGELFKYGGRNVVEFFVIFFNALFDKGIYPDNWSEAVIIPLFKKGDVNKPGNYRGISLCDISSKIYSSIINNRLQKWVEINNFTGEYQAGFKKNYSTIDQMFTLLAIVQKQFSLNRKLYVAFIDFEKAFDSISRKLRWPILQKNGITGKMFQCIRSMYNNVKARVRVGNKFTGYIICTQGVKQGDACSPVLFSLFINELALEIIENGRHGAILSPDITELFILLLADDIVLLSETPVGLQTQLNKLYSAASRLELRVNMAKSNIVVFRKGGYLAGRERWFFNGEAMSINNCYKYLGIHFSTRLSFKAACQDLTSKAKNALLSIMQKLYRLNNNSLAVLLKLFDAQVQPIAQYGAERSEEQHV